MKFEKFIKEDMAAWSKKKREEELALPASQRVKEIEKNLTGIVGGNYKHPNNIEDLQFLKKYKPGSFWKRIETIVRHEHHPMKTDDVLKFLKSKIK